MLTSTVVDLPPFVKTARIERMKKEIKEMDKEMKIIDAETQENIAQIIEMVLSMLALLGFFVAICLVAGFNYAS